MKKWIGLATIALAITGGMLYTSKASACALCGHDHAAHKPAAPHGGRLEMTDDHIYVEVVQDNEGLSVFLYDFDMNPLAVRDVQLNGRAITPRRRRMEVQLELLPQGDHYFTQVDFGRRVHRYDLELEVQRNSVLSDVSFTIEP